jgi:CHAD domain-containing protein
MADRLRENEAGAKGVRRLVRKQVGKALQALGDTDTPSDDAVHAARKELKKARAGLRLLREALGGRVYRRENEALRDAARPLTEVRDAKVLVATLDDLAERFPDEVDAAGLGKVRRALLKDQREVRQRVLQEGALAPVREALEGARKRAKEWPVGGDWSVLGAGLKRTYRAGRDAFTAAREDPSDENLHEWRKQAKYLGHQLVMLQPIRLGLLGKLADQAHDLGDRLGDDHDLTVLRGTPEGEPDRFPDRDAVADLGHLMERRRAELQKEAATLGRRLDAKKPKVFTGRLKKYWRAWRSGARAASAG